MRLFVCEFITGGGVRSQPLPRALLRDACLMCDALVSDLEDIDSVEICSTHDSRLPRRVASSMAIDVPTDVWSLWERCMRECDAVWFIAPETGGILSRIRELADRAGCRFIGCEPDAIRVASSKRVTAEILSQAGIPCIRTEKVSEILPESRHGWVVKPDDGAGSEETYLFTHRLQVEAWTRKQADPGRFVIQPYIEGIPASLSVCYNGGRSHILAFNRQLIDFNGQVARHRGIVVNEFRDIPDKLKVIVEKIGEQMPGLMGYVGLDLIMTEVGPCLVEINPRLTTSYAGLRRSLDVNVAALVLSCFESPINLDQIRPAGKSNPVSLDFQYGS